jgi:ATP-binding cassette subfamily B protein
MDTMANWETVRSHAKEDAEIANFSAALQTELERTLDHRRRVIYLKIFQNVVTLALLCSTLALSLLLLERDRISVGGFVMIFAFGGLVASHLRNLSFQLLSFFEHVGILDDALREIAGCDKVAESTAVAAFLTVPSGAVEFREVTFAYPGSLPVLRGLSFSVRPGEKILIMGASGAGKSTILRLLKRTFQPQQGQILLDGRDVAEMSAAALASAIGDAPQLAGIFQRTIRENVEYSQMPSHASESGLDRVMTIARASDFVARKPVGFETMAGTQGGALSGGERQRIALARMLLKDASLLLFDEATSALDSAMEASILKTLLCELSGTTMIFVSHRMTLNALVDRILVVEDGRVTESGAHDDLLAKNTAYARIWRAREGVR